MSEEDLLQRITEYVTAHPPFDLEEGRMLSVSEVISFRRTPRKYYEPVPLSSLWCLEKELGFAVPPLLAGILSTVSNGIWVFSHNLIGVDNGCQSTLGDLLKTYRVFEENGLGGREWPKGMLPFCDWGCFTFSCVDCMDHRFTISTLYESYLVKHWYSIAEFFEMWVEEKEILDVDNDVKYITKQIRNPFTGKPAEKKIRQKPE